MTTHVYERMKVGVKRTQIGQTLQLSFFCGSFLPAAYHTSLLQFKPAVARALLLLPGAGIQLLTQQGHSWLMLLSSTIYAWHVFLYCYT